MAQVVLTGGNRRFLRLNAVAGDTGKSAADPSAASSTTASAPRRGQRRRDEARTYVALGFEDTDGIRPP